MSKFLRRFVPRRLLPWLRVMLCLGLVELVIGGLWLRAAGARGSAAVERGGLELLSELGPVLMGPPVAASINGQRMFLSSTFTKLSVDQVLARFERRCQEHSGALADELSRLPEASALDRLPEPLRDPSRWLTFRQDNQDGKSGQVVCVVRDDGMGGLRGLVEHVVSFLDSGDLAALGNARYVVARKDASSGDTHVLAMWTDGSFNIPNMFPASGDAPGSDSELVARPLDARRVLSAQIEGRGYALRMYDSPHSHAEVLRQYSDDLQQRGWLAHALPTTPEGDQLDEHFRAFSKDSQAVIVVVEDTPDDKTGVSLIEMGGNGFVHAAPVEAAR